MQPRKARPVALQTGLVAVGLVILLAAYLAAMRLTIDVSEITSRKDADYRDLVYLAIHGGLLSGALVAGFALGKWLSGLGVAFALLFLIVLSIAVVGLQLGSYELACHGRNDLIRHWDCGGS